FALRQLQRDGTGGTFALGMAWGWLPCGMSWSMLAAAAASGDAFTGGTMLFAFGLGTLPALLAAGLAGLRLRALLGRIAVRRAAAVVLIVAGAWTTSFPLLAASTAQHAAAQGSHHQH